jgi:hypothetical protein
VRPKRQIDIRLVGIVVPNSAVVGDDAQRSISAVIFMTPALAARISQCCSSDLVQFGSQLDHGAGALSATEQEVERTLLSVGGGGGGLYVSATSVTEAETQRSIQPESMPSACSAASPD